MMNVAVGSSDPPSELSLFSSSICAFEGMLNVGCTQPTRPSSRSALTAIYKRWLATKVRSQERGLEMQLKMDSTFFSAELFALRIHHVK